MIKIEQLSEQISFLLDIQENELAECVCEFEELMKFLESSAKGDDNAQSGVDAIQSFLSEKLDGILSGFEQDVSDLRERRDMVLEACRLSDGRRKDHVIGMLLEDAGELEDTEEFKKEILEDAKVGRQEFGQMVSDIKDIVNDGGIVELEALFDSLECCRSEECYSDESDECCQDECGACSLHDGCDQMAEALREMAEPYRTVKNKSVNDSVDDKDEGDA